MGAFMACRAATAAGGPSGGRRSRAGRLGARRSCAGRRSGSGPTGPTGSSKSTCPSADATAGWLRTTVRVSSADSGSTRLRSAERCPATGTTTMLCRSGARTGPPAASAYAVEPVAVATTTASAVKRVTSRSWTARSTVIARSWAPRATTTSFKAMAQCVVDVDAQHRPLVAPELTGQVRIEGVLDLVGLELGQEAQRTHPDGHDRHPLAGCPAGGPKRRTVAAECQRQVVPGRPLSGPARTPRAGSASTRRRFEQLADVARDLAGLRPVRLMDQRDVRHQARCTCRGGTSASAAATAASAAGTADRSVEPVGSLVSQSRNSTLPAGPESARASGRVASGRAPAPRPRDRAGRADAWQDL